MMDLLVTVLSTAFLATVVRTTTPLLLATLGGVVADLSGALNVALEGIMLVGGLAAVLVSVHTPWPIAVLAALGAGGLLGALMAFFHLRLKANVILVGLAINILASGGTVYVLSLATGGDKGSSTNLISKAVPALDLSALTRVPLIGATLAAVLSGHSVLSWLAACLVAALWYLLHRMPQGLWIRAVGEYPAAPAAAGIDVDKVRAWSLIISGALAGLGGAQLAMFNYVGFARDMTAGRGFIALGAVLLGARHPVGALGAALLFGLFEALSVTIPNFFAWVPPELIQMIPFVVTFLVLIAFSPRLIGNRGLSVLRTGS